MANAVFDAHRDDPEFGYRFLADEVRHHDEYADVSDRVVWRICRDNGWCSRFGRPKARKGSKPATPAHDDLVRRDFAATAVRRAYRRKHVQQAARGSSVVTPDFRSR